MKKSMHKAVTLLLSVSITLASVLTGCGKEEVVSEDTAKETVVMTIEDHDVTLQEYYLYLIQYCYNNSVDPASVTDEKKAEIISAVTEELKLETVEYILADVTEDVVVSENDLSGADTGTNNFYQHFGADFLGKYGIDKDCVKELFVKQKYIDALTKKALSDLAKDSKPGIEEDYGELTFHSIYYALFPSVEYDASGEPKRDVSGNAIPLGEKELAEQLKKANEYRERALAGESMEELVKEYGIEAYSGMEHNFEGAYVEELNKAIENMENGDISNVIATPAGFMIARMDNNNDEEYKAFLIDYLSQQGAQNMLSTLQNNWCTAAGVGELTVDSAITDAIDVKAICQEMKDKNLY
ncbi:MAG: peptidyl-prolyl cis-trans isomerase [Lachnospiraceae bacterium]|nr:peptidyl-prolyl cis-trans isomerase [Lachnospiraceae bacterium]